MILILRGLDIIPHNNSKNWTVCVSGQVVEVDGEIVTAVYETVESNFGISQGVFDVTNGV